MSKAKLDIIENKSKASGTGTSSTEQYTHIIYPFDNKYEIVVKLTLDGKFVGIEEVRIKEDFRSYNQRISQKAFEYIDSYKPE